MHTNTDTHEGSYSYWIGGTDQGREGDWYWANSLEPVKEFVWHTGEPNNGNAYNCMIYSASYDSAIDFIVIKIIFLDSVLLIFYRS